MKVAVLGAGQMGCGIAQVCATAGHSVDLYDSAEGCAAAAADRIEQVLMRLVEAGKLERERADSAVGLLSPRPALGAWLARADFVAEAITEDMAAKRALYADAWPLMGDEAILASNTSSCSITALAKGSGREGKFLGVHFMNPVPAMELVEIIRGADTSDATLDRAKGLVEGLGKTAVVAEDYPGFIANRILMPLINESAYAVFEGVGSVEAVDATAKLGFAHPMGPLALADLIGLDTVVSILRILHGGHGDPKFRPCPLLVRLVDAGRLGRKSGKGFWDYGSRPPRPAV